MDNIVKREEELQRKIAAATKIQCGWRGRQGRKFYRLVSPRCGGGGEAATWRCLPRGELACGSVRVGLPRWVCVARLCAGHCMFTAAAPLSGVLRVCAHLHRRCGQCWTTRQQRNCRPFTVAA